MTAWLVAGSLLLAASANAADTQDGQRAFDAGQFDRAREIWGQQAALHDARAAFGLGLLDDLGRGGKQDFASALHWYVAAGELGLPEAEMDAAVMYDSGRGTERDGALAALWYARAAAHGDHRAQYDLGQLYADGDGVPRNPEIASAWFAAAAAGGLTAASERLHAMRAASPPIQAPLESPVPLVPENGAVVTRDVSDSSVELVWAAPAQPSTEKFFCEVSMVGADGVASVTSAYSDTPALLAKLPGAGRYVWRVYAVSAALHEYLPSAWQSFTLAPPDARDDQARVARATPG